MYECCPLPTESGKRLFELIFELHIGHFLFSYQQTASFASAGVKRVLR